MTVEEFGDFLRVLRIGKNLSILEASKEAHVDRHLLDNIERGVKRSFPRHKTLTNLSAFYKFRFHYIPEQLTVICPTTLLSIEDKEDKVALEFEIPNKTVVTFKEGEKHLLERALEQTGGNREKAAKILGIGERTIYRKMEEHDIIWETSYGKV